MKSRADGLMRSVQVFSGIQPTGIPHIGNYFGAISQWKSLQTKHGANECLFAIVDLHSLTGRQNPNLRGDILNTAAFLFAAGIKNVFVQSEVREHCELQWYLSCCTQFGELSRMTQWKSKCDEMSLDNCGMFTYPILQAGDIGLYNSELVPVGADQTQHLELTRSILRKFNRKYNCRLFDPLPVPVFGRGAKIMSLSEPGLKKMSKSHPNENSRINVTDSPDLIRKKIARALTDSQIGISFQPEARPGIANLLSILASCTAHDGDAPATIEEELKVLASEYENLTIHQFKNVVSDALISHLEPISMEAQRLLTDPADLYRRLSQNSEMARSIAVHNISLIRAAIL